MSKKVKVGVVFGGRSAEHEVSLLSAKNVITAIDRTKYEIIKIKINKCGDISSLIKAILNKKVDVIFPVLHGPFGEDGTIQGMLKLMGIPFVGSSVLGSAIGMDKDVTSRLLKQAGIPVAKFITLTRKSKKTFQKIEKELGGLPLFIKPANLGSSVGDSIVRKEKEFKAAIDKAFMYDNKILVEEYVGKKRQIECSVLGNENSAVSIPGEIVVSKKHEYYSYEAKYLDPNGASLVIPAQLTKQQVSKIQKLSIKAFKILCCEGMARVDLFLRENGEILLNEINTIPGFTKISMYPKLWEASGVSYAELINRLIILSIERFERDLKLKTTVDY